MLFAVTTRYGLPKHLKPVYNHTSFRHQRVNLLDEALRLIKSRRAAFCNSMSPRISRRRVR